MFFFWWLIVVLAFVALFVEFFETASWEAREVDGVEVQTVELACEEGGGGVEVDVGDIAGAVQLVGDKMLDGVVKHVCHLCQEVVVF